MNHPPRGKAHEDRAEEDEAADQISPKGIGRKSWERQVAGGLHVRQKVNADRLDRRHGEEEHHRRAVHREELVVEVRPDELAGRQGELRAHDQREHAGEEKEEQRRADVKETDDGVVDVRDDAPALRRGPDALELFEFLGRARRWVRQRALEPTPLVVHPPMLSRKIRS
jgi:hypothetical protein